MKPTRDHDAIRVWAARHEAVPAQINPRVHDGQPAVLYFLTGKERGGTPDIHPIAWETFFALFDLLHLDFAGDEDTARFQIFQGREAVEQKLSH